jgi:hypothetical protein
MKLSSLGVSLFLTITAFHAGAQQRFSVRILLGVTDAEPIRWDGTIRTQSGTIASLEPWRFEGNDGIAGLTWHCSTHLVRLFSGTTPVFNKGVNSFVPNGVIANLSADENAEIKVTTAQGDFSFTLKDLTYGKPLLKLGGRVWVDRLPPSFQITKTPEEEDYPSAAAAPNGDVWLAYVQFRHNPEHNQLRAAVATPLKDFSKLKAPTGGDQIFVRKYSGSSWGSPIAVTEPGGDLYRSAIAIDRKGRPWVFWSQNVAAASSRSNFEIFARVLQNGMPGTKLQISRDPGSDIDPVAAADSNGNLWVAWQGWRNGRAAIFAATQNGDRFGAPASVSDSPADEWNPAIAADGAGRVTVAWDSYRNENYDIYARTASAGAWGPEVAVAASARYEAYPSIAYDKEGRLWVAYEEGGAGWGKDFGAYNTNGVAVYQGRVIRLRGLERDGRVVEVAGDLGSVLPGMPSIHMEMAGTQGGAEKLDADPNNAKTREPDRPARNMSNARNTLPRLLVDGSGRIWLAFRSAHPVWWNFLGTVWTEWVTSLDGNQWSRPIYLNHSDNLLDNRPALVSTRAGQLLVLGSADGRRNFSLGEDLYSLLGLSLVNKTDPYNNDLYSNEIDLGPASQAPLVVVARPAPAAGPEVADRTDLGLVKTLRGYRIDAQGGLKIVRGEFHRHSEISMDGGNDGTLLDQYRYILDAGALDWVGCCDHDNGGGREYTWWISQKLTDIFYTPNYFIPMFNYERSIVYPEGHRNVLFAQRGVRVLPRSPVTKEDQSGPAPDTQMLYAYLKFFNGVSASHTSATAMGTDWRDNDALVEPVVEIYQGDRQNYEIPDGPRSNSEKDSIGLWRPKGFVSLALQKGYRLGFEASSDHVSTHMSYSAVLVKDGTREALLDGLRKRHVYGATDNILADVRSGPYLMGDAFSTSEPPGLQVKLEGTSKFAKVVIVRNGQYVYSTEPASAKVEFSWRDNAPVKGKTTYYYVRGEQDNGEIVWISPFWITYVGK